MTVRYRGKIIAGLGTGTAEKAKRIAEEANAKAERAETEAGEAVDASTRAEDKSDTAVATSARAENKSDQAVEVAEAAEEAVKAYDERIQEAQDNAAEALSKVGAKQDKLTSANAGVGIAITEEGGKTIISNTQTSAEWGNIIGEISDQEDLKLELDTLNDRIDNVEARGRFLALWNATTGLPETNPGESPYEYRAGDYYIVGVVGEENYKPIGTQFVIGQPSTVVETEELATDDVYYYDGTTWKLQVNHGKTVSFANLAGQPDDNIALKDALDAKQNELIPGEGIKIENDVITATAATDATTVIIRSW